MKDLLSLTVYFCGGRKEILKNSLLACVCIWSLLLVVYSERIFLWAVEWDTGVHISHKEFIEMQAKHRSRCDNGLEIASHCMGIGPKGWLIPIGEPK